MQCTGHTSYPPRWPLSLFRMDLCEHPKPQSPRLQVIFVWVPDILTSLQVCERGLKGHSSAAGRLDFFGQLAQAQGSLIRAYLVLTPCSYFSVCDLTPYLSLFILQVLLDNSVTIFPRSYSRSDPQYPSYLNPAIQCLISWPPSFTCFPPEKQAT